jgi:hypothetical protein
LRGASGRPAYVVDRRVVVDQASEFAEQVRERLEGAAKDETDALCAIATALKNAGCTSSVVEVSTLRGQRALDTRWRDDQRPFALDARLGSGTSSPSTRAWKNIEHILGGWY